MGIDSGIASSLVAAERKACLLSEGRHTIQFEFYEPDDDRIFTASQMFDFAYEVAQVCMAAAFSGKKSVEGATLDEFIAQKLDQHEGDYSYETWIPKHKWPGSVHPVSTTLNNPQTPEDPPGKHRGGGKRR